MNIKEKKNEVYVVNESLIGSMTYLHPCPQSVQRCPVIICPPFEKEKRSPVQFQVGIPLSSLAYPSLGQPQEARFAGKFTYTLYERSAPLPSYQLKGKN
jgi:hypothetical protein